MWVGRLYFVPFSRPPPPVCLPPSHSLLCVDDFLRYQPFYQDFGPFHLGCTVRFCTAVDDRLSISPTHTLHVHCNGTKEAKSNAAVLIGCYAVWKLRRTVEEAYEAIRHFEPFTPFRDASIGPQFWQLTVQTHASPTHTPSPTPTLTRHTAALLLSHDTTTFPLTPSVPLRAACQVLSCISAFATALRVGLFDPESFSVDEYEHFEQVERGDLNVIVPHRFLAFASPSPPPPPTTVVNAEFTPFTPNMYLPIFRHFHVTSVVRLNQSSYSPLPFTSHGIRHVDLIFPDGSNPPQQILQKFLLRCDEEEEKGGGVIAVHCKVCRHQQGEKEE